MSIPSRSSQMLCLMVFGLCQYPAIIPWDIPFPPFTPNHHLPSPVPPPSNKPSLKVVHISDLHVDLFYEPGASTNCTKNICCRTYTPPRRPPACPPIRQADSGIRTATRRLCWSRVSTPRSSTSCPMPRSRLFTGDVVEHTVWLVTDEEVTSDLNDAYTRMSATLAPAHVYATIGNHDNAPVNLFPLSNMTPPSNASQYVYDTLATDWSSSIGGDAAGKLAELGGCYSTLHPGTNLRVISLNTNFWYKQNFYLYGATMPRDPNGLFTWLVAELSRAEHNGERVWILGHMPMGGWDALRDYSHYFNQIVVRYEGIIAGLFFGHTHKDEFQIAYKDYASSSSTGPSSNWQDRKAADAVAASFIAPALTPTSGNPAFRVYDIDPVTWGVRDYTTYIANISSPSYQTEGPVWEKYYSLKETYGPLLSPPVVDPKCGVESRVLA